MSDRFTFGATLRVVFKYLNESPSVLAVYYVDRDRTLIYKWLRDAATPSKKLVPDIVRFAKENSNEATRIQIKTDLERLSEKSPFLKRILCFIAEKTPVFTASNPQSTRINH